ncbi:hypothetical protein [Lachnospira eligens]|nr:hypothetical protein [Lachnospira eligens]
MEKDGMIFERENILMEKDGMIFARNLKNLRHCLMIYGGLHILI